MGDVPLVPLAALMALISPASEEVTKSVAVPKKTSKALGTSRSELPVLETFLQMNPEEKFDLEAVNSIDTRALLEQARGDKHVLREVIRTAEALLPRVRAETEDPILVSGILRDKTLDWYRRSSTDRTWTDTVPLRWGGMFHESRVPGGRLSRKLSVRLIGLINQAVEASGAVAFLRAGFSGIFRGSAMMAKMVQFSLGSKRPRLTQQVAQAYLDDLAASPRNGDRPLPLSRLSDFARRNGSSEVSMTLAELFTAEGTSFLTVAWKGRPSGPVLLSQLLSKGQWVPEVDTDCDYLEAELDHIEEALADRKHEEGHWALGHGWTVVREVAKGERTYRAAAKSGD